MCSARGDRETGRLCIVIQDAGHQAEFHVYSMTIFPESTHVITLQIQGFICLMRRTALFIIAL